MRIRRSDGASLISQASAVTTAMYATARPSQKRWARCGAPGNPKIPPTRLSWSIVPSGNRKKSDPTTRNVPANMR